jgi:hypothetical protein
VFRQYPACSKSETGMDSNKQKPKRTQQIKQSVQNERQNIMKTKQISSRTVSNHGLAVLMVGLLALSTINLRAEHYTIQDQILVSGTQRLDPYYAGEQHFIRDRSAGVSTRNGLVCESSVYTRCVITDPRGGKTVYMAGQSVYLCGNGDQIFCSFRGTVVCAGYTARNLCTEVVKGTVTVTGGTGAYKDVSGGGAMTCVVSSDGHFSSLTEVTLYLHGEK